MSTRKSWVEVLHDEGYGDNLKEYLNIALRGRDMVALRAIRNNRTVAEERFESLTLQDWLQIDQAARGCINGTSDEWPALRNAISKVTGKLFEDRKCASWLQGFCEGVMIQSGCADTECGSNAGIKCDMAKGPCACGAWH